MIPSTPRRTGLFLGASFLLYFAPDLLTPEAWRLAEIFPTLAACYQGALVLIGFGFGPAICRSMVEHEINAGPSRANIDHVLTQLFRTGRSLPSVILAKHAIPFVFTAGLLPTRCQAFVSSALVDQLSETGLRFLLARVAAHAAMRQRLASLLPVMAFTVLVPDPIDLADWLAVGGFLALWLPLHWIFELDADRQAARIMGKDASEGLHELLAATTSPLNWLTPHAPLCWRSRAVSVGRALPVKPWY